MPPVLVAEDPYTIVPAKDDSGLPASTAGDLGLPKEASEALAPRLPFSTNEDLQGVTLAACGLHEAREVCIAETQASLEQMHQDMGVACENNKVALTQLREWCQAPKPEGRFKTERQKLASRLEERGARCAELKEITNDEAAADRQALADAIDAALKVEVEVCDGNLVEVAQKKLKLFEALAALEETIAKFSQVSPEGGVVVNAFDDPEAKEEFERTYGEAGDLQKELMRLLVPRPPSLEQVLEQAREVLLQADGEGAPAAQ